MRSTDEILQEVNQIFRSVFKNDSLVIGPTTTAVDVPGWDSLSHTSMIVAVEKHFQIKFKLKELLSFKNVGDMVDTIALKCSPKPSTEPTR